MKYSEMEIRALKEVAKEKAKENPIYKGYANLSKENLIKFLEEKDLLCKDVVEQKENKSEDLGFIIPYDYKLVEYVGELESLSPPGISKFKYPKGKAVVTPTKEALAIERRFGKIFKVL